MLTFLTVVAVLLGVLWLAQRSLIYFPESDVPAPAALGLAGTEEVRFQTEDGLELNAWFVPAAGPPARRTIVVFNGNAGNRSHRAPLAAEFAALGYATLLVDYRGYGGNPGLPSEEGLARDARAAWKYVTSRPDVEANRLVYFGESLGSAVAVRLAVDHPPAALILRSPFSSLVAIGAHHYPFLPVRWFLKDRFQSVDLIRRVPSPVLFIAGDADRVVPFDDTEALFAAANDPKEMVVIQGADHNDEALNIGPGVIGPIHLFLER